MSICCNHDCNQGRDCPLRAKTDARTIEQAKQAIKEYGDETAGGGEPHYPQWAADILKAAGK